MSDLVEKINRNWWIFPILAFIGAATCLSLASAFGGTYLLAAVKPDLRKDIYSSLTGSSSGLLGFALAAVAILAAFAPKIDAQGRNRRKEEELAEARSDIAKCLLVTSAFLMVILVASTIGIGADAGREGNPVLSVLVVAAGFASLIGLLISGLGVTLSILERNSLR
jgi:cytochrome bd-type quinol oxidase subunit 2